VFKERGHSNAAPSPGMQDIHYSPVASMFRFEAEQVSQAAEWCRQNPGNAGLILVSARSGGLPSLQNAAKPACKLLLMPDRPDEYAQKLYAILHQADEQGAKAILIEIPPDEPAWIAVRDRITRASKKI